MRLLCLRSRNPTAFLVHKFFETGLIFIDISDYHCPLPHSDYVSSELYPVDYDTQVKII